jgi:KaiC/GvpD/RAD55 family RecA-like ATPase
VPESNRQSTGITGLDDMLGGGLLPGTMTVVVGSTGIGKTQLGLQFADAGHGDERRRGVIFDVAARGDSQNHAEYAKRMFDWSIEAISSEQHPCLDSFFDRDSHGDYLHVFDYRGQRVTKQDLDWDEWRSWQVELNAKLRAAIAFLYGNFVSGKRRVVIDGIEPTDRPHESIQLNLCEYVYHQILRKDPEWVARDLFRESYRENAAAAANANYDSSSIGCLMLCTSHESMLNDLISRRLDEGDALSNANTLIYMGKTREGNRIGRGIYVAKHRGSSCSDQIVPYRIDDQGLHVG